MAGTSKDQESELATSLSNAVDDLKCIPLLKTYASKIADSSFPMKNVAVRKDVCCELKNRLAQSKDGRVIYEMLKLLLKFSRDDSLLSVFDMEFLNVLQRLSDITEFESFPVNLFAWKCLSNIIYLTKDSKGLCSNKEFLKRVANQLFHEKDRTQEEKILLLRVVFLATAMSGQGRTFLVEECNCRRLLLDQLHACFTPDKDSPSLSEDSVSMMIEILKVFFNVMMDLRSSKIRTQQTMDEINDLLRACHKAFSIHVEDPLMRKQLHCSAGHAAYSIPLHDFKMDSFLPLLNGKATNEDKSTNDITKIREIQPLTSLLAIMDKDLKDNTCLQDVILPIVAFFALISRINSEVRKYLKQLLLPPRKNFAKRPEDGNETSHKLIQLLTNINPAIKMGVADFLFVLCKENADKFVKYTGYGNAAGLLASRGLLAGGRGEGIYSDSDTDSETEEYKAFADDIDPVTGHIHEPRPNPMEDMSDEQKEYLAVQLANEISKLSSNSAIQPMCVGEDGKLISMHEKFHRMKDHESGESSDE